MVVKRATISLSSYTETANTENMGQINPSVPITITYNSDTGEVLSGTFSEDFKSYIDPALTIGDINHGYSIKSIIENISAITTYNTVFNSNNSYIQLTYSGEEQPAVFFVLGTSLSNTPTSVSISLIYSYYTQDVGEFGNFSQNNLVGYTFNGHIVYEDIMPPAPSVTVSAGVQTVTLSWSKPTVLGYDISGYNIYVDSATIPVFVSGLTKTFTYSGTPSQHTYIVKTLATDSTESSSGTTAYGTPLPTPSIVPPSPVDVSAGVQTVTLSWSVPSVVGYMISGYNIYVDSATTPVFVSDLTKTFTYSGTPSQHTYIVKTLATDSTESSSGTTAYGTPLPTPSSPSPSSGVPCIPAGQRILTPTGYRHVESLRQGDLIKTAGGRTVPVTVYKTSVTTTTETAPVQIGALRLSPNHTFKVNKHGWMFPGLAAKHGLHGAIQEAPGAQVDYYHVETPNYLQDDLVVEGVVVESFGAKFVKANSIDPSKLYVLSKKGLWFVRMSGKELKAIHP
jgi:hypothetical protein